ncbi:hypothetical protein FACS189429_0290 [Bacteroidia bacterium]|nr:hypothetical protein FACS189429_0290 [Bacteroidia bacterium]
MATTVTYQFSTLGSANISNPSGTIDANISFATATTNGANTCQYNGTWQQLRLYSVRATGIGNLLTFTAANGMQIKSIVLTKATGEQADQNPSAVTYKVDGGTSANVTITSAEYQITGITGSSVEIMNAHSGGNSNLQMRLTAATITYEASASNQVAAPVISPVGGFVTAPVTVSMTCATDGANIFYTTNGNEPNALSAVYTAPFTVSTTTTVRAKAMKPSAGLDPSSTAEMTYTFPEGVANIAAFLATEETENVQITGDVTVVYQNEQNLYVQDGSGYLLVYGNTGKTFANGDVLTGLVGKLGSYGEMPQMTSPLAPNGVSGTAVTPTTLTWAAITTADHARYAKIENIQFSGDFTFGTTNSTHKNDIVEGNYTVRNNFNLTEGVTVQGSKLYDVTGFVAYYAASATATPVLNLYFTEIVEHIPTSTDFALNTNLKIYSNNGNIAVENATKGENIAIYNALGQLLVNQIATEGTNTVSVQAKGILIVKAGAKAGKIVL